MKLRRTLPAALLAAAALLPCLTGARAAAEEACADWSDSAMVPAELIGVPDTVVAGEWAEFTFRAVNAFGEPVESLHPFLFAETTGAAVDVAPWVVSTVEWNADGEWLATDDRGYFAVTGPLRPREYAEARVRMRVPARTEDIDWAVTSGVYVGGEGTCQLSEWSSYAFDVVADGGSAAEAGTVTGERVVGSAQAPQGEYARLPADGRLAETGSSTSLPVFALAGATILAAGVGALILRRREART